MTNDDDDDDDDEYDDDDNDTVNEKRTNMNQCAALGVDCFMLR